VSSSYEDIGTLYDRFYDDKRKSSGKPEVGQIVFCPVIEANRRLWIGDVQRVDSHAHTQVQMHIREQRKEDFRGKEKRLPIKGLQLDSTHELVISRAKLRPCLVVGTCEGIDAASVPDGAQRRLAANAFPSSYLLAPAFHVSHADEYGAFGPVVTARIKCLMYAEFFYLRQSGGYIRVPSVVRLDRIFIGAPHPGSGFELADLFLIPEIMTLVHEQVRFLFGKPLTNEYLEIRDMMLSFLPKEARP
jgi:hypothetical protein